MIPQKYSISITSSCTPQTLKRRLKGFLPNIAVFLLVFSLVFLSSPLSYAQVASLAPSPSVDKTNQDSPTPSNHPTVSPTPVLSETPTPVQPQEMDNEKPAPTPTPTAEPAPSATATPTAAPQIEHDEKIPPLPDKIFSKAFPELEPGFKDITLELESESLALKSQTVSYTVNIDQDKSQTEYLLESGVKINTQYQKKTNQDPKVISLSESQPIKQIITIDNPTSEEIILALNINQTINAQTFFWDGKEYQVTDEPQIFKAYQEEVTLDPQSGLYDEALKGLSGEERSLLPGITVPSYRGTAISFTTPDGQTGIYDFSDVTNLDHEVTIQRQGGNTILTLTLQIIRVAAFSQTVIDPSYDLATSANYNLRYDGAAVNDFLSSIGLTAADLDGNGKPDLLVRVAADNNSRANSGSVYVIYDSLLDDYTGTGNNIDLATSSNYNLRYDGAVASDFLGVGKITTADINANGKADLVLGTPWTDYNSRTDSGSVYIIYDSLLDDYTGTGNNIDLATSSNYNLRYDGAVASYYLTSWGALTTADLDANGKPDLLVGAAYADYNSRTDSGSVYIIYDSLLDDYTGTGNNINLATSSNYNLRYDGAVASDLLSYYNLTTADLDANGKPDLLVGAYLADNNSRTSSGSVYIIYDSLLDDYTGTGNNINLATSANYNLRYDGAAASNYLTALGALTTADLDANGKPDLLVGAWGTDNNSRTDSGSVYIIYDSLLDDYTGTGNNIDLATSANYNLRYDGAVTLDYLSVGKALTAADLDANGKPDLLVGTAYADYNSRTDSGSVYIIYDSLLDDYTGTGNNIDLATSANYNLRYDGAVTLDDLSLDALTTADLDANGKPDLLVGAFYANNNSRTFSGSLYIIYNFPHSFSLNSVSSPTSSSAVTITGSVSASNSITNISQIQDSVDSSSFSGTWSNCTASDGAFNSTSESFSCSVTGLSDGSHTVYFRAYDANTSYTAQTNYGSATFTVDTTAPSVPGTPSTTTPTSDNTPTWSWTASTDSGSGLHATTPYSVQWCTDSGFSGCAANTGTSTTNSFTHSTALADGTWYFRVKATDAVSNESSYSSNGSAVIDTTAPASGSVSINSGVSYATSRSATLTISASGASQMIISENSDFSGASWETYSTSKSFTLSSGDGTKTVYIKFRDEAENESSSYSDTITLDVTNPTTNTNYSFDLLSPKDYSRDSTRPTLSFKKATDATSGISSYTTELDSGKNKNYSVSGIPSSGNSSASYIWRDNSEVKVEFLNENDSGSSNDEIRVYFKGLDSSELTEGKHTWKVTAYDNAGNSTEKSTDFYIDKTSASISELAIANISSVSQDGFYKLDLTNRTPSFSGKASDPYQGSEKTNPNGSKDTFDKVSSGPEKITLTLKKLKEDNVYEAHLTKEYTLSDIQDNKVNNEKYSRFYITVPYPLVDGYYKVNLSLKDKAENTYNYPVFYFALNYQLPAQIIISPEKTPQKLKTEVIERKEIPPETEEEKEQIKQKGPDVKVKVVDKDKNPVAGAKVILYSQPKTEITDEKGEAFFKNVEPGEHKIVIAYKDQVGEQRVNLEEEVKQFYFTIQIKQTNPLSLPIVILIISLLVLVIGILLFWIFRMGRIKVVKKNGRQRNRRS